MLALVLVPAPAARAQGAPDSYFEFLMARRLEGQGDTKGALAALQRAARADRGSSEVQAEIASFHLRQNEPDEAAAAAKSALALSPENAEANRVLGLVLAGYVDAASERTPTAQTLASLRDAIDHLERAAVSPTMVTDLTLHYTLGRLHLRNGAPDKAMQSLGRVLTFNPGAVQARLMLAQAQAMSKDLPGAIDTLELIVDDEPRVAATLARYQELAGRYTDAAESYTKALAVQPTSRELKARRISSLQSAKQYQRAAALAADARRQHPEDPVFVRLQARALFDGGDRSGAIALMESTLRTAPADNDARFALVDLYNDAGRAVDAEKQLRQILVAEPTNPNALNYLGYLLASRGEQLDEAIRLVRRALEADPDNAAYLDSLGWAYFRRGDLGEAEKYLKPAADRLPGNSEIQDHLGDLHARQGRWQDAIAAWSRALTGDGEDLDRAAVEKKIRDARSRLPAR